MQPAVIDAVEAALQAVVFAADAGQEVAVLVADGRVEAVHTVVDAVCNELGEHRRRFAVEARVAEVLLPRPAERGVDDELPGLGIVGCRCRDGGDIRPVARLGHREGAGNLEAHDVGQERVVVVLGAELQNG